LFSQQIEVDFCWFKLLQPGLGEGWIRLTSADCSTQEGTQLSKPAKSESGREFQLGQNFSPVAVFQHIFGIPQEPAPQPITDIVRLLGHVRKVPTGDMNVWLINRLWQQTGLREIPYATNSGGNISSQFISFTFGAASTGQSTAVINLFPQLHHQR